MGYIGGMKVKTSVTLTQELLDAISRVTDAGNRSALIEEATWSYLRARTRAKREKRELELINKNADALNEEAIDVFEYQDFE